jgi:crotonobetainyl-CoA:carnitine CoA-transferase CaiB-like acyl-CoA transferase
MSGPLTDVKVVECGRTLAAALCAKLLADLGAEVVKVEPPGGDPVRWMGPFPGDRPDLEKSALFHHANTNKLGVTLDLADPEGRRRLAELAAWADILVDDRPAADRLPLPALPQLIHVSISAFGQSGPYATYAATDLIAWHASGAGHRLDGFPEREPLRPPAEQAHQWGAIVGALGALTAYRSRRLTGRGQRVDVSEAQALAQMVVGNGQVTDYNAARRAGDHTDWSSVRIGSGNMLPCKDGYVFVLALEPHQWGGLVAAMGNPEWAQTDLFAGATWDRQAYMDLIHRLMAEWLASHTKEEIFRACQAQRVPTTPVLTVAEVAQSGHLRARGFFAEVESRHDGRLRLPGAPYRFSATPWSLRRPAPGLGEHNNLVFGDWLGQGKRQEASGKRDREPGIESTSAANGAPPATDVRRGPIVQPTPLSPYHPLGSCLLPLASFPLRGLRVVNFGWVWAAPVAGHLLADMGAEVIRIESRRRVDLTRQLPPLLAGHPEGSLYAQNTSRSQLSITLNLADPAALDLVRRLVAVSDVVIQNFSPGVLARHGLAYADLARLRPDLVMISMSAAGQDGPLRDVVAYGVSLAGLTGFNSLNGYPGERPLPLSVSYHDPMMGLYAAFAVLCALAHRDRTGEGQHIDLAQLEAVVSMLGAPLLDYFWNGRVGRPAGNRDPHMAPHGVFPSRPPAGAPPDAPGGHWIAIACRSDTEWRALCGVAEHPDWAADRRFAGLADRKANEDALEALLGAWTAGFTAAELTERLQRRGIPAAPALSAREVFEDPHFAARQGWVEVEHPLGRETIYGLPFHLSETPGAVRRAAPLIGQDNPYVYGQLLGLPDGQIGRLHQSGAIS